MFVSAEPLIKKGLIIGGLVQKGYDELIKKGLEYLYLMKGTHIMMKNDLIIEHPINIIGAGRDQTFVKGYGFAIQGKKEEGKNVVLKDMTISLTKGGSPGLSARHGLSFLCKDMTFTQCRNHGVTALNTKGRLINCVITQCGGSGIRCSDNALIEFEGSQTKVDGNGTPGHSSTYGLWTFTTSSIIHLLFPLTKESVSTNNNGGGNYGSHNGGTIETVKSF